MQVGLGYEARLVHVGLGYEARLTHVGLGYEARLTHVGLGTRLGKGHFDQTTRSPQGTVAFTASLARTRASQHYCQFQLLDISLFIPCNRSSIVSTYRSAYCIVLQALASGSKELISLLLM